MYIFVKVFVKVYLMIFIYVFTYFTNTTTSKRRFKINPLDCFFQPTSERTPELLASLSQLNFLLPPFLTFLCIASYFFLHCFVFV